MARTVKTVKDASFWCNGVLHNGGPVEFEIKEIAFKTAEQTSLGQDGTVKLPTGIEAMECTVKLNAIDADFYTNFANPNRTLQLMFRTAITELSASGTTPKASVYKMSARVLSTPGINLKAQELAEFSVTFTIDKLQHDIDGVPQLNIDILSGAREVQGVDINGELRAILGT